MAPTDLLTEKANLSFAIFTNWEVSLAVKNAETSEEGESTKRCLRIGLRRIVDSVPWDESSSVIHGTRERLKMQDNAKTEGLTCYTRLKSGLASCTCTMYIHATALVQV
jgi:hypothetical protein